MAKETTGQLQVYNRYLRRKRTALAAVCAAAIVVALYAVGMELPLLRFVVSQGVLPQLLRKFHRIRKVIRTCAVCFL